MKKPMGLVTASVVAVGAFYCLFAVPAFSDYVCPRAVGIPAYSAACGYNYDPVSTEEAGRFLHDYYNAATRTDVSEAWNLLDEDFQRQRFRGDEARFRASVSRNLWTEIIGSPTPGSRPNEFFVRIRYYQQDQLANGEPDRFGMVVNPLFKLVRLRPTPDGVRLLYEGHERYDAGRELARHHWAHFNRPVDGHDLPSLRSTVVGSAVVPAKKQRTSLRALCQIMVTKNTAPAEDTGWWTRTNRGWFKNTELTVRGAPLGIRACDDHVLALLLPTF